MRCRFDTVIFDLDGTLVDTVADVTEGVNYALGKLGFPPLSVEKVKKAVGPGKEEFVRILFPDDANPDVESFLILFREFYWEHCLDETDLYPGMKDVLTGLRDRKLAIASNKPSRFSHKILEGLGIREWFQVVLGPEDVLHAKPHPEMILKAISSMDAYPNKTLLVGDTDKDMLAGRGAGVSLCGVEYGYGLPEELSRVNPEFIITIPSDLLGILKNNHS